MGSRRTPWSASPEEFGQGRTRSSTLVALPDQGYQACLHRTEVGELGPDVGQMVFADGLDRGAGRVGRGGEAEHRHGAPEREAERTAAGDEAEPHDVLATVEPAAIGSAWCRRHDACALVVAARLDGNTAQPCCFANGMHGAFPLAPVAATACIVLAMRADRPSDEATVGAAPWVTASAAVAGAFALLAVSCCVLPLALVALVGLGGSWLVVLAPFVVHRSIVLTAVAAVLVIAWLVAWRRRRRAALAVTAAVTVTFALGLAAPLWEGAAMRGLWAIWSGGC